jgi:hypothetical protein
MRFREEGWKDGITLLSLPIDTLASVIGIERRGEKRV